jgi:hypothetical protein
VGADHEIWAKAERAGREADQQVFFRMETRCHDA